MTTLKDPPPRRRNGRRPVVPSDDYDPTVSTLYVGERPWDCLPLTEHLHGLWQVLGLDDEDTGDEEAGP